MKKDITIYSFLVAAAVLLTANCSCAEKQDSDRGISLSLSDIISSVIEKNPLINEAGTKWKIKKLETAATVADFEPQLTGKYHRDKVNRAASISEIQLQDGKTAYAEENELYSAGIEGKTLTGGVYWAGGNFSRQYNTIYEKIIYDSFIGISYEQPLLKGAWLGSPYAPVEIAQREEHISFQSYRQQLMDIIAQVEAAYWELTYAQEKLRIAGESRRMAEKIVEDSEQRVRIGKMAELDLQEAQAGLQLRMAQQAESEQDLHDSINKLKILLSDTHIKEDVAVIAKDPIVTPELLQLDCEKLRGDSLVLAERMQPDLISSIAESERDRIVVDYRINQRLPELNIKTSYGLRGQGETLDQSNSQLVDNVYPGWSVDVELKIPVFSGLKEHNELMAAKLKQSLSEKKIQSTEYELTTAVDTLIQRISSLQERIKSMETIVQFHKRLLDVEVIRMQEGKSDIRKVFEVERDYNEVTRKSLETIVQYRSSLAQLYYLRGTLLEDKGFSVTR